MYSETLVSGLTEQEVTYAIGGLCLAEVASLLLLGRATADAAATSGVVGLATFDLVDAVVASKHVQLLLFLFPHGSVTAD